MHDNNILTPYQSCFTPGDSTTNQLTYLYNTFSEALDSGKDVREVFCDNSKAFDRVSRDIEDNIRIFQAVQKFIEETKRFS